MQHGVANACTLIWQVRQLSASEEAAEKFGREDEVAAEAELLALRRELALTKVELAEARMAENTSRGTIARLKASQQSWTFW